MALLARAFLPALLISTAACSEDPDDGAFGVVLEDVPGALISVWASSDGDTWAVGGEPEAGDGPTVLHLEEGHWRQLPTGTTGDLWWVHGFAGGPVFMGGDGGVILRWSDGVLEQMPTPGTNTVFGIWGDTDDDVWAVGGAGSEPSGGFVWRYDGTAWTEDTTVPPGIATEATIFKVWGRSAGDVYMVGTGGLVLHHDGDAYEEQDSATTRTLFTVSGDADRVVAVGGFGTGVIVENIGDGWEDVTPPDTPQMIGVDVRGMDHAVGTQGAVMQRDVDGWTLLDPETSGTVQDLHSVWVDVDGGVFAVGGQVAFEPLVNGTLVYNGPRDLPGELE